MAGKAFELEEQEPVAAMRGELEVGFEKGSVKEKAVPSLADATGTKEGRRRKKRDHPVQQLLRQFTPYSGIHDRTGQKSGIGRRGRGRRGSGRGGENGAIVGEGERHRGVKSNVHGVTEIHV